MTSLADRPTIPPTRTELAYQTGFGNQFETEALPGTLPIGQNSPQQVAHGLYAEQLSGSPFTAPRVANERSWLYRIRPSVLHHGRFAPLDQPYWCSAPDPELRLPPGQQRWDPVPIPDEPLSFVEGIRTVTTAGDVATQNGMAAHLYFVTRSMQDEYFANADGELLVVPEDGALRFRTEFGILEVEPGEIVVIPRGIKFCVELLDGAARGYVCENYGGSLTLPERGPIGANCLANPRDFLTPVAAFEDREVPSSFALKWGGRLWSTHLGHSPLDVVAWHGNYAPYKYDLTRFSPVGPLRFDHADPSIFTTLTSPSETPGTANVDFVIFPDRWMVAEGTFRPPWFHQNVMSELMGLVRGVYDAKPHGFVPGGISLHNSMTPHGPDAESYAHNSTVELKPERLRDTLAFMFETRYPQRVTAWAANIPQRQEDYADCWQGLQKRFDPGT